MVVFLFGFGTFDSFWVVYTNDYHEKDPDPPQFALQTARYLEECEGERHRAGLWEEDRQPVAPFDS